MTIKYRVVNTVFSIEAWSQAIGQLVGVLETESAVADYLGLSSDTIHKWVEGNHNKEFPHPSMSNFLKVINALDLWPRDMVRFFEIEGIDE